MKIDLAHCYLILIGKLKNSLLDSWNPAKLYILKLVDFHERFLISSDMNQLRWASNIIRDSLNFDRAILKTTWLIINVLKIRDKYKYICKCYWIDIFIHICGLFVYTCIHCISQILVRLSFVQCHVFHLPRVHHSYWQINIRITDVQL